jgi:hypothetical protein
MSFLSWQVKLRAWTMAKQHGAPHAGVAPIVSVRRPGTALGVSNHSIICGLLPRRELLAAKTAEFRALYDRLSPEGARGLYDAGIAYLTSYYADARDFDASSVTTLLHAKSPVVEALRAEPACSLLFYVFDLRDRSEIGAFRCWQLDCRAALHERGDVFDNVYWHNALFHGMEDDRVAVQFFHQRAWDTQFASFSALSS